MYLEGCSGLSFKKISCLQRWSAVLHLWWDIRHLWCTEMSVPISDSPSFKLSEQSDLLCIAHEVQTLGCNSMPNMLSRVVSRMTVGPYMAKQSPLELKKVEQEVPNLLWELKDFFPHDSIKISGTFTHSPDSTKPFCSVRSSPLTEKILNWVLLLSHLGVGLQVIVTCELVSRPVLPEVDSAGEAGEQPSQAMELLLRIHREAQATEA